MKSESEHKRTRTVKTPPFITYLFHIRQYINLLLISTCQYLSQFLSSVSKMYQ